jgi:transcriptional regulator GlxA family with amidase domain
MIRVAIIGFDGAFGSAITGPSDLLSQSGITWNRIYGQPRRPRFTVEVVSAGGKPITCVNNLRLQPHGALETLPPPDVLIVPTIGGSIEQTLAINPEIIAYLQQVDCTRTVISSNCTGAFFLAEAGLLEGKDATTHWGAADLFRQRYPNVLLKPEQMITQSGNILCAGGGQAWFDLCLYLVERFVGHAAAVETAKGFVIDLGRRSQFSYVPIEARRQHSDPYVHAIQAWIDKHYVQPLSLEQLQKEHGLSVRTLIRRFKKATGDTPLAYIQAVRMEEACKLLETQRMSIESIAYQVGYEDISSFSKVFKQMTGLPPSHYRERYKIRAVIT